MKLPLQITVRNISLSTAAEDNIREKAAKLDGFCESIMSCRVVVEAPHKRHHKGVLYNVRIDMTVPGSELVVKREPHEDLYVAIRDAFDAARRQLEEHVRRQREAPKTETAREAPAYARVARLLSAQDHGFLETHDGREVYFHRNSVLNGGFDRLKVGVEVRYTEELGEKGPQASTVALR